MSENETVELPSAKRRYRLEIDNPDDPKVMTVEIPIAEVAYDKSVNGIIFMLGFFEHAKNEAINSVVLKRRNIATNNKILTAERKPLIVH